MTVVDSPVGVYEADAPSAGVSGEAVVQPESIGGLALAAVPLPERQLLVDLDEPVWKSRAYLLVSIIIACAYLWTMLGFWAPAHPGVDQNGYLVGGRVFAETFSTGVMPANPFQYFGAMWVMTPEGWLYPKYPLGIPILTAACFWLGGNAYGPILTYLISPICAAAALVAMFLLTRQVAGSFFGLIGQLLLATNAIFLTQTNNPWSHMPDVAFVLWGMVFLVWWWRFDGLWRGAIAGLLLGFSVLIRYTEGLLLIPMAVVALSKLRWRSPQSYLRCATPFVAWLAPVVYLLVFNKLAMGTLTGYDTTNESTGFEVSTLTEKWRTSLSQLYQLGAFFILPMGLLGLILIFVRSWRMGLLLLGWFLPGVMIYSAYYWGGERMGMGFLRFFLSLIPPLLIAACWLFSRLSATGIDRDALTGWRARAAAAVAPVAVGVIVVVAGAASLRESLTGITNDFVNASNLSTAASIVRLHTRQSAPESVILFAEAGRGPSGWANYLQFATGFELYAHDAFSPNPRQLLGGRGGNDSDQPNPVQPLRREAAQKAYAKYNDAQLIEQQNLLMNRAFTEGRRVLLLLPASEATRFTKRFVQDRPYQQVTLATWRDPVRSADIYTPAQDQTTRQRQRGQPGGAVGALLGGP
ncbi:MAG TPA: glycosyltransferase family 39 protein, partial [Tepidisphaeraceae bacterium]|nr:glycosyltransferase family 39 protein [Tepidisphaeraceae bacterium]